MRLLRKLISMICLFSLMAVVGPSALAEQSAPVQVSTPAQAAPSDAHGQPADAKPAEAPPAGLANVSASAPAKIVLKEGTPVDLKFTEKLSSKHAKVGDPVELVLDQDLAVGPTIVAKKGAKAVATVSQSDKAGMAGRGGKLNVQLEYLEAGDTRIKLRGMQGRQGDDKTGATVGLVVAFGLVGFMKHGKQAEVKEGTPIKAYVDRDTEVPVAIDAANPRASSQEK